MEGRQRRSFTEDYNRQAVDLVASSGRSCLLILDDLAYVTKDQAETSVLFELISARYERRSMLITANQPFGEWNKVFPEPMAS
jgi:DNA replication protein DnaC